MNYKYIFFLLVFFTFQCTQDPYNPAPVGELFDELKEKIELGETSHDDALAEIDTLLIYVGNIKKVESPEKTKHRMVISSGQTEESEYVMTESELESLKAALESTKAALLYDKEIVEEIANENLTLYPKIIVSKEVLSSSKIPNYKWAIDTVHTILAALTEEIELKLPQQELKEYKTPYDREMMFKDIILNVFVNNYSDSEGQFRTTFDTNPCKFSYMNHFSNQFEEIRVNRDGIDEEYVAYYDEIVGLLTKYNDFVIKTQKETIENFKKVIRQSIDEDFKEKVISVAKESYLDSKGLSPYLKLSIRVDKKKFSDVNFIPYLFEASILDEEIDDDFLEKFLEVPFIPIDKSVDVGIEAKSDEEVAFLVKIPIYEYKDYVMNKASTEGILEYVPIIIVYGVDKTNSDCIYQSINPRVIAPSKETLGFFDELIGRIESRMEN
ncbi:MAG: hypothetical protein AAGI23_14920 [Bacteroidota bacterium]